MGGWYGLNWRSYCNALDILAICVDGNFSRATSLDMDVCINTETGFLCGWEYSLTAYAIVYFFYPWAFTYVVCGIAARFFNIYLATFLWLGFPALEFFRGGVFCRHATLIGFGGDFMRAV
jgi:hypothetical protein